VLCWRDPLYTLTVRLAAVNRCGARLCSIHARMQVDRTRRRSAPGTPRHPVSGRVLDLVGPGADAALWPAPCPMPLLLLYDRQEFEANRYALSNVLPAARRMERRRPAERAVASLVSTCLRFHQKCTPTLFHGSRRTQPVQELPKEHRLAWAEPTCVVLKLGT
jgi:hypothetical protein